MSWLVSLPFFVWPTRGERGPLFQTAWFLESLSTQILVIFVIRTRKPFFRSRPSRLLLLSSICVLGFAFAIPFTPLGALFGFVVPPPAFFAVLVVLIVIYLALVEVVKIWFYRQYGHLERSSATRGVT